MREFVTYVRNATTTANGDSISVTHTYFGSKEEIDTMQKTLREVVSTALVADSQLKRDYTRCIRCGRVLKNPEARERGYGDICWKKHLSDKQSRLF